MSKADLAVARVNLRAALDRHGLRGRVQDIGTVRVRFGKLALVVVLPTPPLPEVTTMIFAMRGSF